MKLLGIATFLIFSMHLTTAKTFTRCELAKELRRQGFSKLSLSNWVCLVEAESSRRTTIIGHNIGSNDYGLFQINDRYWCKKGVAGNECKVKCEDINTDDITKASKCAMLIYNRHKFEAWNGWKDKCKNKILPNVVKECKL